MERERVSPACGSFFPSPYRAPIPLLKTPNRRWVVNVVLLEEELIWRGSSSSTFVGVSLALWWVEAVALARRDGMCKEVDLRSRIHRRLPRIPTVLSLLTEPSPPHNRTLLFGSVKDCASPFSPSSAAKLFVLILKDAAWNSRDGAPSMRVSGSQNERWKRSQGGGGHHRGQEFMGGFRSNEIRISISAFFGCWCCWEVRSSEYIGDQIVLLRPPTHGRRPSS